MHAFMQYFETLPTRILFMSKIYDYKCIIRVYYIKLKCASMGICSEQHKQYELEIQNGFLQDYSFKMIFATGMKSLMAQSDMVDYIIS